ncbi:hypothetical protein [Roseicyclus mahoneyensis]|uniref:Uncharacterized protein n=1 Tax=Roseicyclus mahoneyensis TaxID=164332 RepID=A0A316GG41_9RHOB|nr:hypothetical protein [Roseicyclus mahoneyensis]PWK59615.1 hypothetical protein C7455_107160 [Roseicyclus mahoneyensis]
MRLILASATALLMSTLAALAQTGPRVQMADCTSSGCTCRVTDLTVGEIAATANMEVPDDAENQTFLRDPDGNLFWTDMSPDNLDLLYGGQGSCPLQLFEEITPRDGRWFITDVATDASQCPMVGMAAMGGLESHTVSVSWGGRFHPERIFPETQGMVAWSRTGDLSWRGIVVDEEIDGAFARVTFTARLVSPTVIRGESRFAFNLNAPGGMNPASVAAGMGCLTVTTYVARWRG